MGDVLLVATTAGWAGHVYRASDGAPLGGRRGRLHQYLPGGMAARPETAGAFPGVGGRRRHGLPESGGHDLRFVLSGGCADVPDRDSDGVVPRVAGGGIALLRFRGRSVLLLVRIQVLPSAALVAA